MLVFGVAYQISKASVLKTIGILTGNPDVAAQHVLIAGFWGMIGIGQNLVSQRLPLSAGTTAPLWGVHNVSPRFKRLLEKAERKNCHLPFGLGEIMRDSCGTSTSLLPRSRSRDKERDLIECHTNIKSGKLIFFALN